MKRLLLVVALLLAGLFLLPRAPGLRRLVRAGPETCEGRFEGRWRLLPSEREANPGLAEEAEQLEITVEDVWEPTAGNACPSIWGAITVDGLTRNYHSSFFSLVFNDGDSFVTDPSGENLPLSVMVWKQEYRFLPGLLRLVEPLGEAGDQLELQGYVGGRKGSLRYERAP
jgi:hypothetical protein